jgi:two-component system nitrogen regulation response regulator NtrX
MDVRLIASSNKDLEKEIKADNFRQDLYFRLNVIPIHVPPLRDRKEDIPKLVDTFLDKLSKQSSENKKTISENALKLLADYEWPGNVRELKNLVERLAIMVKQDLIDIADMPQPYNPACKPIQITGKDPSIYEDNLNKAKKHFETQFIKQKLSEEGGDLKSTAKKLGTSVRHIKKNI